MVGGKPAGVGAEGGEDQPTRVGEEARPAHRAAATDGQTQLGMEVAGDLAGGGVRLRGVAEGERPEGDLREVPPAEGEGAWVVVAGDPDPVAPRQQRGEPGGVGRRKRGAGGAVVETVAEADDAQRRERGDLGGEAVEGLGRLVGRQQRAAAAGESLGLAEVQVGDQSSARPARRGRRLSARRARRRRGRGAVRSWRGKCRTGAGGASGVNRRGGLGLMQVRTPPTCRRRVRDARGMKDEAGGGDDAVTDAEGLLLLAQAFHEAAGVLLAGGRAVGAPGRVCAIHAIELYLSAFLALGGMPEADIRRMGHDLASARRR